MELFFVPTSSMKATILENDYVFSTKYSYGYSDYSLPFDLGFFKDRIFAVRPIRGDIIIFKPPNDEIHPRYVKRLIGMPGDKIHLSDDVIYINDVAIKREFISDFISETNVIYNKYQETLPNGVTYFSYKLKNSDNPFGNTKIFYVPENEYFFMGDNRDESNDSRVQLGFVPFKNFIAKARFIIFSTKEKLFVDDIGILDQILRFGKWITSIRYERLFKFL
jgi:signal peptidase I